MNDRREHLAGLELERGRARRGGESPRRRRPPKPSNSPSKRSSIAVETDAGGHARWSSRCACRSAQRRSAAPASSISIREAPPPPPAGPRARDADEAISGTRARSTRPNRSRVSWRRLLAEASPPRPGAHRSSTAGRDRGAGRRRPNGSCARSGSGCGSTGGGPIVRDRRGGRSAARRGVRNGTPARGCASRRPSGRCSRSRWSSNSRSADASRRWPVIEAPGRLVAEEEAAAELTSARAAAARWRSPPESSAGRWEVRSASPTRSSSAAARWRRSPPDRKAKVGMSTFSSTVYWGSRWWSWKTKPTVSFRKRARSVSEKLHGSRPAISIRPRLGRSRVPIRWRMVLLPEPDGPVIATASPERSSRDTPRSTFTVWRPSAKLFSTSSRRSTGVSPMPECYPTPPAADRPQASAAARRRHPSSSGSRWPAMTVLSRRTVRPVRGSRAPAPSSAA